MGYFKSEDNGEFDFEELPEGIYFFTGQEGFVKIEVDKDGHQSWDLENWYASLAPDTNNLQHQKIIKDIKKRINTDTGTISPTKKYAKRHFLNPFKNIIFVTLDGYRKDKLDLCPNLKAHVEDSIYFENMITVAPYTLAAHHSIFSGMYPSRNGVNAYYNMFKFKKNEIATIPEILKEQGYYTSCDIINDVVIPAKGFDEVNIFDEKTVNFKKRHTELITKLGVNSGPVFI